MRRKNNEVVSFICGCVMFCFLFIVLPGIAGYYEHHYTREAEVIGVCGDLVRVEDNCGFEWEFYGEGYEVGQKVEMKMFTNFTHEKISDDEIKEVEIRG